MTQHEYAASTADVLGHDKSFGTSLRFGAEVETGWHSEKDRLKFFKALEAAGLDKIAMSKFDRSISGEYGACSEIVTAPMVQHKLVATLSTLGDILVEMSDVFFAKNCGVHVHASLAAMPNEVQWRVATAIMQNPTAWKLWKEYRAQEMAKGKLEPIANLKPTPEIVAASKRIDEFWTLVALRQPTGHCARSPYSTFQYLERSKGQHGCAVIYGNHTPTMEFRLFKTPRSKTVLASYVEAVAALIAFSENASSDLLMEPAEIDKKERPPVVDPTPTLTEMAKRYYVQYANRLRNGDDAVLTAQMKRALVSNAVNSAQSALCAGRRDGPAISYQMWIDNYDRYCSPDFYAAVIPLRTQVIDYIARDNPRDPSIPRGWKDVFPLEKFCAYVLASPRIYPNLCARLKLAKFAPFVSEQKIVIPKAEPIVFDVTTPHVYMRQGCLVVPEFYPKMGKCRVMRVMNPVGAYSADHTIVHISPIDGEPAMTSEGEKYIPLDVLPPPVDDKGVYLPHPNAGRRREAREGGPRPYFGGLPEAMRGDLYDNDLGMAPYPESVTADELLHICPGAQTKGGHDE